jgi:hypothetical protein
MSTFTDLVKKLNDMESAETVTNPKETTSTHSDPNVQAMATILESVNAVDEKKDQLKGKDAFKKKSKPGGSETPHPARGKLVGEDNVQEDLLGQLKKEFTDLLVTKEEQQTTEDIEDETKIIRLQMMQKQVEDLKSNFEILTRLDQRGTGAGDLQDQITTMYKAIESLEGVIGRSMKIVPEAESKDFEEAVGEFADPIYDLMDQLGVDTNHPILDELIRYLDGDTIKDFVADYKRHHEVPNDDRDVSDAPFKAE